MVVIALAGDRQYLMQIETTIKSICHHNRSVRFYVLNSDIPTEWFHIMQQRLRHYKCEILDAKVKNRQLEDFPVWPHINYTTYLRYFIPLLIPEKKVLYLDSDIIITGSLQSLFDYPLSEYPMAAVPYHFPTLKGQFNAGVLLIDNVWWREQQMTEKLLYATANMAMNDYNGDESILNRLFVNKWHILPKNYNYLVGYDGSILSQQMEEALLPSPLPIILHYITDNKPWNEWSKGRLREVWWYYYQLEWTHLSQAPVSYWQQVAQTSLHALTVTYSDQLKTIVELIESLPFVQFHIAAPSSMSDELMALRVYRNVTLHPMYAAIKLSQLIHDTDVYLDINAYHEVDNIIERMRAFDKPIFAYSDTVHRSDMATVIVDNLEEMIVHILKLNTQKERNK